jgi:hypothetical protein
MNIEELAFPPDTRTWTIPVPVVMLIGGAMISGGGRPGAHGAITYPGVELARSAARWNGKPVTLEHPPFSAVAVVKAIRNRRWSPATLAASRQIIGVLRRVCFRGGALRGIAVLNEDRVIRLDPKLLIRICDGETIEVSTGLGSIKQRFPNGLTNAHHLRPDHLAVLPNSVGAASRADGCGLGFALGG